MKEYAVRRRTPGYWWFEVAVFDGTKAPTAIYLNRPGRCTCPGGQRFQKCKHMELVELYQKLKEPWLTIFWQAETGEWNYNENDPYLLAQPGRKGMVEGLRYTKRGRRRRTVPTEHKAQEGTSAVGASGYRNKSALRERNGQHPASVAKKAGPPDASSPRVGSRPRKRS